MSSVLQLFFFFPFDSVKWFGSWIQTKPQTSQTYHFHSISDSTNGLIGTLKSLSENKTLHRCQSYFFKHPYLYKTSLQPLTRSSSQEASCEPRETSRQSKILLCSATVRMELLAIQNTHIHFSSNPPRSRGRQSTLQSVEQMCSAGDPILCKRPPQQQPHSSCFWEMLIITEACSVINCNVSKQF